MTEKRFRVQEHCLRSSYGIEAENWLVTNDNHSVALNNKAEAHMVANMCNDVIDVLNELNDENTQLKKQLHDCRIYNGKLYANGVKKDKPIVNDLIKQRKENTRIKQTIQEAYNNERTAIGKMY